MKVTTIIIFLTLFLGHSALAEQSGNRKKPDIDALIVQFKLDESRAKQFKNILKKQKQELRALRRQNREKNPEEKQKVTREERQKQRHARQDARDEELLTVLTYEQLYNYKKYMRQFRRQPKKERMKKPAKNAQ